MDTLHDRIVKSFKNLNMSQSEFARKLSVTPAYVWKILNKEDSKPSERLLEDMCEKLGINRNWLIYGGDDIDMFKMDFEINALSDYCAEITEGKDSFIAEMLLKYKELSPKHKQAIWEIYEEWTKKKED